MKTFKIISAVLLFCGIIACEKEFEEETLPNYEMSGQWYVQTYYGGTDPGNVVLGYQQIVTSNTAQADGKELLIDDKEHIWPFKVIVNANSGAKSFSGTGTNGYQGDTTSVTISNGKIIKGGGRSLSGIKVDSIYMEAEFSDDPGNTYIFAGHYRTGFEEDEP